MLLQSGSCAWKVRRHRSTPRGCPRRGSGVAARRGAAAAQPRRAGCPAPGLPKPQTLPPLQLPRTANGKAYAAVSRAVSAHAPRLAAKDAQFSGACNEPGFRPIGARGAEPRVLQRAHCESNSRVGAYAAVIRAVSAHAPGWPQKTHNSPAHATSPVSGRSAHGGRSPVFCSALAATGLASWHWANTNFGAAPCVFGGCRLSPA
jgi:hypothetical protein